MHRACLGVDSGVPVRKQTRHHVARVAREGILMWIRAKPPCMHFVRIQCDSVDPVEKLTRDHVSFLQRSILAFPRAKFSSRVDLDLEASRSFRPTPHTKIWGNFVQSYFVRILAYGTWLRSLMNAPCLPWSRFGRSRQEAHTVSYGILRKVEPDL